MASNKQKQHQQKNNESVSSLTRLSKIPLVEFSIYITLSAYTKVKSSSELSNNVLNRVEKLASGGLEFAKPIANKYEKQISLVDSYGNLALDKLESTVPSVTSFQPKNAYANASNRFLSWQRYLGDKLNVVRNLDVSISNGLKSVDNLLDDYLPGSSDEQNENRNNKVDDSLLSQATGIASKLRKRLLKRFQNIQRLIY